MAALGDFRSRWLATVLFLAAVPAVAHALFSPLGFNPTDDGFTLAYSRRLLDGQVAHRDFIIIRPFLSPLMHVPIVRWGGDSTFLVSRYFVWLELGVIAWTWLAVVETLLATRFTNVQRFALALLSLIASAHTFPIMAWHTIDGLLFTVLGMACAVAPAGSRWKPAGYLLMGFAYLCKQSFFPVPFLVLALLGDWRRPACLGTAIAPGLAYVGYLAAHGAIRDGLIQLTSQGNALVAAVTHYWRLELPFGLLLGTLALWWIGRETRRPPPLLREAAPWIVLMVPAVVMALALPSGGLSAALSYALFGMLTAYVVVWLMEGRRVHSDRLRLATLALIVAWSASMSVGYHVPTLGSGEMLVVLLGHACTAAPANLVFCRARTPIFVSVLAVALLAFGAARTRHIYRESPAADLVHRLDRVLPGGHRIRTNLNTYLFLADLNSAVDRSRSFGGSYSILPDCAGWWVRNAHRNPMSIDWAQGTELANPELVDRAVAELELARASNVVIVQKAEADALAGGFTPLRDRYAVVRYVRRHFRKIDETPLFELYR